MLPFYPDKWHSPVEHAPSKWKMGMISPKDKKRITEHPHFQGPMNAVDARKRLTKKGGKCYLIRFSESHDKYMLSVMGRGDNDTSIFQHFPINITTKHDQSEYEIEGSEKKFEDILQLLEYYEKYPISYAIDSIGKPLHLQEETYLSVTPPRNIRATIPPESPIDASTPFLPQLSSKDLGPTSKDIPLSHPLDLIVEEQVNDKKKEVRNNSTESEPEFQATTSSSTQVQGRNINEGKLLPPSQCSPDSQRTCPKPCHAISFFLQKVILGLMLILQHQEGTIIQVTPLPPPPGPLH